LVWGTFRTPPTLFITLSFSDIESGLLFMHILDVAKFKKLFYKIKEKFNEKVNFKINSLKHSVHC
jgi:negative regulator of genetic competence, sporulation and motility